MLRFHCQPMVGVECGLFLTLSSRAVGPIDGLSAWPTAHFSESAALFAYSWEMALSTSRRAAFRAGPSEATRPAAAATNQPNQQFGRQAERKLPQAVIGQRSRDAEPDGASDEYPE